MRHRPDPTDPRVENAVLELYGTYALSFADIALITDLEGRVVTDILRRYHFPTRHNAVSDLVLLRGAFRRAIRW